MMYLISTAHWFKPSTYAVVAQEMDDSSLLLLCSILGTAFSIILSLAPIPAFFKAWRSQSLKEISRNYVFMSNINNLAWLLYSIQADNFELIVPNCTQTVIGFCLIVVYFQIEGSTYPFLFKYIGFVFVFTFSGLIFCEADTLGLFAGVLNLGTYLAPLDQVKMVIAEHNPIYLDFNVVVVALGNSTIWLSFGLLAQNLFVALPNAIGCVILCLQLSVYLWASDVLPQIFCKRLHERWAAKETAALKEPS